MTHLVDTSVWHKYGRYDTVAAVVDQLDASGAIFSTCPPVIAEYCFSARSDDELSDMQDELSQFYQLDQAPLTSAVQVIQRALVSCGLPRAAGALDVVIAAHAVFAEQVLVTCDQDFLHIAKALAASSPREVLSVIYISDTGEVTTV